jgi:hypothetical protein
MLRNSRAVRQTLIVRSLTSAGTGAAGKLLGLFNQIVSVALISSALGADGLEQQLLAIALVSWSNLTLCGMHVALPALLIRSGTDSEAFASIAKTAFLLAALGAFGALGVTLFIGDLAWGFSSAPVATAAICCAATNALGLSERVFQATDRIAQFNALNMTGTAISLAATVALTRTHGTVAQFVVAYYLGMLFPVTVATFLIIPRLNLKVWPSLHEFRKRARQLIKVGVFGFGYEQAAYCKLQAPLALLSALGISDQIPWVGLGLRLVALAIGGLSIITPILFLQIGAAIQARDQCARRLWTRLGIGSATIVAVAAGALFLMFGQTIYDAWTSGIVTLAWWDRVALAAFLAACLAQNLLFSLSAPDLVITRRLRWLFWLEGPVVLAGGTAGALSVPVGYGGAGLIAGATLVTVVSALLLLASLANNRPSGATSVLNGDLRGRDVEKRIIDEEV